MNIKDIVNKIKAKTQQKEVNADVQRIQRENAYAQRIKKVSPRLSALNKKLAEQKRRHYGQQ